MKIELITIGKTEQGYLTEGIKVYENRLRHYCNYSRRELPELKQASSLRESQIKEREGELALKQVNDGDNLILLDERGERITSEGFSEKLESLMLRGTKRLVFMIGGAYGFSEAVYKRADGMLSLSSMTFSHQMVRLIFTEQIYRAFTIIKGEPYHHK